MDVAQARETVWAWTLRGSCVRSTISRPMRVTVEDGITCPNTTESTSFGGIPVRATSSFTTSAPRSTAERSRKSVPALTKGVRSPATTAARRPAGREPFMPMRSLPDSGIGRLLGLIYWPWRMASTLAWTAPGGRAAVRPRVRPLALPPHPGDHRVMKRSRALKPLSSEHHQALLVAFQLKKGLAGHAESAGAPKDLPGLLALARRFEETVFLTHTRAEEELLGSHLSEADMKRLRMEHAEMVRLLVAARQARPAEMRQALTAFADLVERHVR